MKYGSRLNTISVGFIYVAFRMTVGKEQVRMCEILQQQLIENVRRIKKDKYTPFIFKSLIIYLLFQAIGNFPNNQGMNGIVEDVLLN